MKGCYESTSVSILVNGSLTNESGMEKVLRQGDPMTPFLFLVVAEGLNALVRQAVRLQKYIRYRLGGMGSK